jgi:hypothetical protein
MDFLKDRRLIALGGAGLALVAGLAIAWFMLSHSRKPTEAPPASQGGLVVVSGRDDDAKLDPKRPLRCFVGGQFVGELPLAVCAQRNGVATGALDVGLDQAGALAAGNSTATLTPLQQAEQAPPPVIQQNADGEVIGDAPTGQVLVTATGRPCWRYGATGWRELPVPMSLQACVQAVYAGRCPSGDDALYARWAEQSLRLKDGRVEVSSNNRDYAILTDPWPPCDAQPAG